MSRIVLTNLPDIVLGDILGKLDLFSILTLRKVCHRLRNFIDQLKPKSNFDQISVVSHYPNEIIWRFWGNKKEPEKIEFQAFGNSCWISWETDEKKKKGKILGNSNYLDLFSRDFEGVMKYHQRDFLEVLQLDYRPSKFHKKTLETFQKMAPLRVKNLNLRFLGGTQFHDLLSCFQPGTLEFMFFTNVFRNHGSNESDEADLEEIAKMEQWKKAKSVDCSGVRIAPSLQNFLHFEEVTVRMKRVPYTEIDLLKENFLHSPIPQEFHIFLYYDDNISRSLSDNYGTPLSDTVEANQTRKSWFFKIPDNKNQVIRISWTAVLMKFIRIPKEEMPREARIIE